MYGDVYDDSLEKPAMQMILYMEGLYMYLEEWYYGKISPGEIELAEIPDTHLNTHPQNRNEGNSDTNGINDCSRDNSGT